MTQRDLRSVGELLLSADVLTRQVLWDVSGQDGPPMLRTWGEVVQCAADLWKELPAPRRSPDRRADEVAMTRLESLAQGMHRAQLRTGWPGDGPADERLLQVAETFSRAAALVARYHRTTRPMRPEVRADVEAARMRVMHALYVGAHGVGSVVREHVRDERMALLGVRNQRLARAVPRGKEAIARLAACEQLAGAYVIGRYVQASQGEVVIPPDGVGRLREALAAWDIRAHRTLASSSTPANLVVVARTQATVAMAALAVVRAGAVTGRIDADACSRLSPAAEAAHASWVHTAGRWSELISPVNRRTDPDLLVASGELRAAMLEITHDRTSIARPEVMAGRVDLAAAAHALQQALAAAVDVAYVIRDVAAHDQNLSAPARMISRRLARAAGAPGGPVDDLAAPVSPADVHANRLIPLPGIVRTALLDAGNTTVTAAAAMSVASCLARGVQTNPADGPPCGPGGTSEDRQIELAAPEQRPTRAR